MMWKLQGVTPVLTVPLAGLVYLLGLVILGAFKVKDMDVILSQLPLNRFRAKADALQR